MAENRGIRKTVYFRDNEGDLLDYALKQSNNFAFYVKELIKKDRDKEPLEKTVEKIVEDYLKNKQILVNNTEQIKESDFNEDDVNALNVLMKRG